MLRSRTTKLHAHPKEPTTVRVPDPEETPLLTVREAGAILGLSQSAAYRAIADGSLPSLTISGRHKVPTARLRDLLGLPVVGEAVDLDEGAA
jgi:excisionase family DNA binding protein